MKNFGRKFVLLIWKHYHLRKSRWILSTVEIFLPILIAFILTNNADSIVSSDGIIKHNATAYPAEPANGRAFAGIASMSEIFYTPENASQLMKEVISILGVQISYTSTENEESLESLLSVNGSHRVGIVFEDLSAMDSETGRFSYKIRDTNDWFTNQLFFDKTIGPVVDDFYRYGGYVSLQMGLNKAVLRKIFGNFSYDKVLLQPFPYPEYTEENEWRKVVPEIVCYVVILTVLILSIPLIMAIIEEKESGVKELMKIVGLQEWLIWIGWFFHALILSIFSFTVVTYLLQHEFTGPHSAAIRNVHPTILWSCIILYCVANTAFCFTFAAIFHQTTIAASMFLLILSMIAYGSSYISNWNSMYLLKLSCLFPVAAFIQGFRRMAYFQLNDLELTWTNLASSGPNSGTISVGFMFAVLIFDTVLYLFLAFYISAINPGKFGVKKPPFFIFEHLRSKFGEQVNEELVNLDDPTDDRYIEKPPTNLETAIKIKDLHKNFGSVFAVKGVNLNVYKGEITALLGHNGAGKTTTLAILTGLIKPTDGSITYKNEIDVLKRMDEFRHNLGMCPQEDRLFPYLSVVNHLLFFGMLKGASKIEAFEEAREYMHIMEIDKKANSLVASLSGGMKRKLCLSIALMGKSETLILDEPTSGIDVESRRKLWDLLLAMRGTRTIILTTHNMEEADALGDRIAIMNHGAIVCHGTSLFLKKSYGTGYQVTITKQENSSAAAITRLLTTGSNISDITLENETPTEIVYKLPLTETKEFPNLFRFLEVKKGELGIENIGVSCTTMEQVFLKVGGKSIYNTSARLSRKNSTITDGAILTKYAREKRTGPTLVIQQVKALIMKKWLCTTRNWITFIYRVLLPTLIVVSLLQGTKKFNDEKPPIELTLVVYPHSKVMIQNSSNSDLNFMSKFKDYLQVYNDEIIYSEREDIVNALLKYGREDLASFQRELLLAGDFNTMNHLLLYNRFAIHSLPVLVNAYTNIVLQAANKSIEVIMTNHPLNTHEENCEATESQMHIALLVTWFLALVFFTIDLNTYFVTSLNVERIDGFKHIQLMSNVSPLVYWFSNFTFDFIFFFAILVIRLMVFKILADQYNFLSFDSHFGVFILILLLFVASTILFSYVSSFSNRSKDGSYVLLFILNIFGSFVVIVCYVLGKYSNDSLRFGFWSMLFVVIQYVVMLLPPLNYSLIFIKFFEIWFKSTLCFRCPNLPCGEHPYLVFTSEENPDGILKEVLFLIFDVVVYTVILSFIQMGYIDHFTNYLVMSFFNQRLEEDFTANYGDGDVKLEKAKVEQLTNERSVSRQSKYLMTAEGLRKNFINWRLRPFTAVADVNFVVKPGECFGLLGVNGAGKSTTFRMLTADLLPTEGDSSLMGYRLRSHKTEYLSRAGYCAQSNCFLEELSGREMLTLIASLRGIRPEQVKGTVDKWLSILGLEEYQNQYCGQYSGGNKRKLCTAMSLIGEPHAVFLDEPTSGVDPVSRRKLYTVMDQSKGSGQAVILTSHSMEECEKLCDRLTILVKGRMRCIGSAQHLKKSYAQGFSVLIKIPDNTDKSALTLLKTKIEDEFGRKCILKDEHKTQLYYQITNVDLLWSTLFEKMEKMKDENRPVLDDYSLSDTSLEEVFISFAKQ